MLWLELWLNNIGCHVKNAKVVVRCIEILDSRPQSLYRSRLIKTISHIYLTSFSLELLCFARKKTADLIVFHKRQNQTYGQLC